MASACKLVGLVQVYHLPSSTQGMPRVQKYQRLARFQTWRCEFLTLILSHFVAMLVCDDLRSLFMLFYHYCKCPHLSSRYSWKWPGSDQSAPKRESHCPASWLLLLLSMAHFVVSHWCPKPQDAGLNAAAWPSLDLEKKSGSAWPKTQETSLVSADLEATLDST